MTMQQNIGGQTRSQSGQAVNYEKYLAMTKNLGLTKDQQLELIDELWLTMQAFADAGYDSSCCETACGENASCVDEFTASALDMIKSNRAKLAGETDEERGPA